MLRSIRAAAVGAIAIVLTTFGILAAQAGDAPKQIRIAGILPAGIENAWSASVLQAVERLKAEKPHGVEIVFDYTENVWGDKALTVFKTYADAGYDIHLHEPAYVLGVLAGMMTKSNTLGVVGLFPADDVNDQVNAYRAGAQSVNPDTKVKVTFIESWYDPAKAAEAANAQIAAGADYIFQLGESFETCKERKVYCFGNYVDGYKIAGDIVPTSTLVYWDPVFKYLIDEWHTHKTKGTPYAAPEKKVWFTMAEGGGDIAPYHDYDSVITPEAKQKVDEVRKAIMSGSFTVELDTSLPKSD